MNYNNNNNVNKSVKSDYLKDKFLFPPILYLNQIGQ